MPAHAIDPLPDLPSDITEFLQTLADRLENAYRAAKQSSRPPSPEFRDEWAFYEHEMREILAEPEINWRVESSTRRTVVALGRTFRGEFILPEQRGIVAKFQPGVTVESTESPASNVAAVQNYRRAVKFDDTDLFADCIHCDPNGRYIVQELCVPIFPSHPYRDEYGGNHLVDPEAIREFRTELNERGWSTTDPKNGNIGRTDAGDIVLLDYDEMVTHVSQTA